jgi:hypothetical protein
MKESISYGLIHYDNRFSEFDIVISESGGVIKSQKIEFCPWCGSQFPPGYREEWFDALESMGIDPLNDIIPEQFQSDRWREKLR